MMAPGGSAHWEAMRCMWLPLEEVVVVGRLREVLRCGGRLGFHGHRGWVGFVRQGFGIPWRLRPGGPRGMFGYGTGCLPTGRVLDDVGPGVHVLLRIDHYHRWPHRSPFLRAVLRRVEVQFLLG